jgi:hypothetical protein
MPPTRSDICGHPVCGVTVCCSTSCWTLWVVGTGLLWDVSALCDVVPPPGLYGVVGTGVCCHGVL